MLAANGLSFTLPWVICTVVLLVVVWRSGR